MPTLEEWIAMAVFSPTLVIIVMCFIGLTIDSYGQHLLLLSK